MQCTSCGTLLPPDASTCPNCGAPVAAPRPAPPQLLERTPSYYDEYVPFTDQETPPLAAPASSPLPSPSPSAAPASPPLPSPSPSIEPYMQATEAGEALTAPPIVSPMPSRRIPFVVLTTTISVLSLLVITVLIFLLAHNANAVQTSTNHFATSDPQAIYTQVTSRTPTVSDVFSSKTSGNWAAAASPGNCVVSGTSLRTTAPQGGDILCASTALKVSNFACQVQITLTKGDTIGLIFRADTAGVQAYYVIDLTSQGSYLLGTGQNGTTNFKVLAEGNNSTINTGHGLSNLLTLIAQGNIFYVYVNKQFIISTSDSSSSSGLIDIAGGGAITNVAVDATFSHFQIWNL